ncbi:GerAB/ArcD/ProY family transporter [Paenibacillus koleovorans]|uniref:GerAB/ArcD/ProY family transporter n=1 Tax=Paenibacillus koleovorans TaxID=121608 RepID=UPI000FDC0B21|nr:endospore germination permease [Paenibacillus koleovorans]
MNKSIGLVQITMIILSSVGLINHVFIIPVLMDVAGRDAWISILLIAVPVIAWAGLLYWIMKKSRQQHLLEWVSTRLGGVVGWIVVSLACLYLFVSAAVTVRDTVNWAITSYLPQTPKTPLLIGFLLVCYLTAVQGIRVIAIQTGILLPAIVALGFFVAFSNGPNKDYLRLLPVLEYGMGPVWQGALVSGCGLIELTILLFMQPYLTHSIRFWQVALIALILLGLTFGPVTGGIAEYGPQELSKLRYPAFEEWKLIILTRNVERLDFLSIYQWMAGAYLRISTALFLIQELMNRKRTIRPSLFQLPVLILLVVATLLPLSDERFYLLIKHLYLPGTMAVLGLVGVILGVVTLIGKKEKVSHG